MQPEYDPALCVLSVIGAGPGRKDEPLREGKRAMELRPVEKDSVNGMHMIEYLPSSPPGSARKTSLANTWEKATRLSDFGLQWYGQLKLLL